MNKRLYINIFFLVIYTLSIFMPVIPLVEYVINYDYISEVLCENKDKPQMSCSGKCYLQKQMKTTIEKKAPSENENSETQYAFDSRIAVVHKISHQYKGIPFQSNLYAHNHSFYCSRFLEVEDKPPSFYSYI